MADLFYVVGLGNPGPEYMFTRHNAGFMALDLLQREYNGRFARNRDCCAHIAEISICDKKVVLVKPQTFMNKSGVSVNRLDLARGDDGAVTNLLVVFDDFHLPIGAVRYRESGSHGGHNGMRSIINVLGTQKFHRLRIGIGTDEVLDDVYNFVLGVFTARERDVLSDVLNTACESVCVYLEQGIQNAMNRYNSKVA